jgi:peroxiredoxin
VASAQSKMVELGSAPIEFVLYEPASSEYVTFTAQKSNKATLIIFMCNHCPYVIHIAKKLSSFAKEYMSKGVSIIAINPNDPEQYPADSPQNMKKFIEKYDFIFPYLFDETQEVAKAYMAQCTPEFYLYDSNLRLQYHGQFDSARPGNGIEVTGDDLRNAVEALLAGELPNQTQKSCVGCSIKWK